MDGLGKTSSMQQMSALREAEWHKVKDLVAAISHPVSWGGTLSLEALSFAE